MVDANPLGGDGEPLMSRLVLAYHRPPDPASARLVEALAERLDAGAVAAELEVAPRVCLRGGVIVALLPARGGHFEWLSRMARLRGCRVHGPLPPAIVGEYAARAFRRHSCGRGRIVFRRARRYVERQAIDMARAAYIAARTAEMRVGLLPYEEGSPVDPPGPGECAAVATLLPSRILGVLQGAGWPVAGRYILEDWIAMEEILLWASNLAAVRA